MILERFVSGFMGGVAVFGGICGVIVGMLALCAVIAVIGAIAQLGDR